MCRLSIFEDLKNEAHIIDLRNRMKFDNSSFILKIKRNTKITLTTRLKSELSHSFAIKNLYRKASESGCNMCKSGLEVVGRDCSLVDAIIETSSVKQEYKQDITGCLDIYFKLKEGHNFKNLANTVQYFEKVVHRSFETDEQPTITVVLKTARQKKQPDEDDVSRTLLVLPPLKSSLDYLFAYLKLEQHHFVCKLEEAGVYWLGSVFSALNAYDQVDLFGKEARKHSLSKPFSMVETLVKYIANGGETMVRQREDLITMLITVDEKENIDTDSGAARIIELLKENMESSKQLTDWIESVDSKYPLPAKTKLKRNLLSFFGNIILGFGMFMGDVGTDGLFTYSMINIYQESLINSTNNDNKFFFTNLIKIEKTCRQIPTTSFESNQPFNQTTPFNECLDNLNAASWEVMNSFHNEVDRFSDSNVWYIMFLVSLSHMIIPLVLCIICGFVLARKKKQLWKIPDLLPVWAKIRMFYYDIKLNQLMSEQKSTTNEVCIKELKKEIVEHQGSITLALLIEANSESSFQFVFQTLYRLHVLILIGQAANQNEIQNLSLLNLRNLSILMSFFTMAFSCFAIRYVT